MKGDHDPDTLMTMGNVAQTYTLLGDHGAATPLLLGVLAGRQAALGGDHPWTLMAMAQAGICLDNHGDGHSDSATGRMMCEEAVATARRTLGDRHHITLDSIRNLGSCLQHCGDYVEMLAVCGEAASSYRAVFGAEHPNAQAAQVELANARRRLAGTAASSRAIGTLAGLKSRPHLNGKSVYVFAFADGRYTVRSPMW